MIYNMNMATKWKVTSVQTTSSAMCNKGAEGAVWRDAEDGELEKLSRGATVVARESMKRINAQKAQDCRKQMLQELLSAK